MHILALLHGVLWRFRFASTKKICGTGFLEMKGDRDKMSGTRNCLYIVQFCSVSPSLYISFLTQKGHRNMKQLYRQGQGYIIMIIHYNYNRQFLVPHFFVDLPSLYPLSFQEMISVHHSESIAVLGNETNTELKK